MNHITDQIKKILVVVFILLPAFSFSEEVKKIKVFYSMTDLLGWEAVVKGRVMSFSAREKLDKDDIFGKVQQKSKVTVRLSDTQGITKGSELFIINRDNLIVSRLKADTIFKSSSFGHMLIGYGTFRLASQGDRVVIRIKDELSRKAFIHITRGKYYEDRALRGKSIAEYKKAIAFDRGNPEAHFYLGNIYLSEKMYRFAINEYSIAYSNKFRLYDNEDRFELLRNMGEVRLIQIKSSSVPGKLREKYRAEGKKYSQEALALYPESADVNYLMGCFEYVQSSIPLPSDRAARDYFLKVLEKKSNHTGASVALAELYFKHKNYTKARYYATTALESDPGNVRAIQILDYIRKGYNRQ